MRELRKLAAIDDNKAFLLLPIYALTSVKLALFPLAVPTSGSSGLLRNCPKRVGTAYPSPCFFV